MSSVNTGTVIQPQSLTCVRILGKLKLHVEGIWIFLDTGEQTRIAVDATNRWTGKHSHSISASLYNIVLHAVNADNVFSAKSWCKNKFGLEDSAIDKQFSIPEDFDYIN